METGKQNRNRVVGGLALIVVGLIAFAAQFIDAEWLGLLILPALGFIFLAWGLITRQSGLLIPGGILSGLGAGTLLLTGPYETAAGETQAGIFLLAFAAGWVLIPILATLFTPERHLWALIPAAVLALIGAGLLFGGAALTALEWLGRIWPVFLILGGLLLIFRRGGASKDVSVEDVKKA